MGTVPKHKEWNQLTPSVRGALWMLGAVLSFTAMAIAVRELQRHMGLVRIVFCAAW